MTTTMHHIGDGMRSPCGLEPASVYSGFQGGFTNVWTEVDCPACLSREPTDVRPSVPDPDMAGFAAFMGSEEEWQAYKDKPETPAPDTLQVFMAHADVIDAFRQWVDAMGWELKLIPRFDEDDNTYVPTHMIVPKNLDELMRQRAADYRKEHGL